jgi:GNAT superfamily N-acetyltransferase
MQIRTLTLDDVPGAQRLRELAKWNQTDQDWKNLIAFEPNGCFAAIMDGKIVGTATSTRFEPSSGPGSFGWIGMVLVDPEYRRHGIGSTLLKKCIEYLKACGVETVKLDATPVGKLVYEKLGFVAEYELERWEGTAAAELVKPPGGVEFSPLKPGDVDELNQYDTPIFGAQRRAVLEAWLRGWPEHGMLARMNGKVSGYVLVRPGANYQQIGPVIGDSPIVCSTLLTFALTKLQGQRVILDIVSANAWAKPIAEAHGLNHQRPFLRMAFGANSSPGQREKVLAICCPELG